MALDGTLTAPIVSSTSRLSTQSLTVSGLETGDTLRTYLNNIFYSSEIVSGTSKTFSNLTSLVGSLKFDYVRGSEGTSLFSSIVTVSQAPTLNTPTFINDNVLTPDDLYIGEKLNITDIESGSTLNVFLNGSTAEVGIDYTIVSITGGFQITFLISGTFSFYLSKTDYINSISTSFIVGTSRSVTITPPTVVCTLHQNGGGTYDIVLGNSTILTYTGSKPSGGHILWYEKNLDTNLLSSRGNTETLEVTPNVGNYGYVAKFADINSNISVESNLIRFNFVSQSQTVTPTLLLVNTNDLKVILGSQDENKVVELWGKVLPSTSFVFLQSVSTSNNEYTFVSLVEGVYKVRSTQVELSTSEFSDEIIISSTSDCNLSFITILRDTVTNYLFNVFFLNPDNINVKYTLFNSDNTILQTGNLTTVNTEVTNQKKGVLDFSNIIEGTGYKVLISSLTTSCSLLSSSFVFDIISNDINVTTLLGSEQQDCKSFNIINIVESIVSEGLNLSFQPHFSSSITNNPPYNILITKGLDILYQGTQSLVENKLNCLIPSNKVPSINSNITILVIVSSDTEISDVYGCSSQIDYTVSSNILLIEKSLPPVLNSTDINSIYLSVNCCIGAVVDFYINSIFYKTGNASSNVLTVPLDYNLKVGDVITAKQSCPNKLKSDFSESITITSSPIRVSGGNIIGDNVSLKNMLKTYHVVNLQGSTPFVFHTDIQGGFIEQGLNTDVITIRLTNSSLAILTVVVTNIEEKYNVTLTKNITITQYISMLVPPQLINYFNHTITGKGTPQSSITLYNSNSEIIVSGIIVDSRGLFTINEVPFSDAYYTIAHLNNETSNISNVLLVKKEKCNCKKCCNNCSINYDTI